MTLFDLNFLIIPALIIALAIKTGWLRKAGLAWYDQLGKPNWAPPGQLLNEIWIFIYVVLGLAVLWYWNVPVVDWLHYIGGAVLLVNFYYNLTWHKTFFREHNLVQARKQTKIMAITAILAAVLMSFSSLIVIAIMLPYVAWQLAIRYFAKQLNES
jgi:translocator protein